VERCGARPGRRARAARRAFTVAELQALFDYADDQVAQSRAAGRKGWLSLFRDATLFKVAYSYGLRRREVAMLDLADFGTNPHAAEFGDFGICRVRFGKAMKGSAPKPRSVLTVWPWTVDVLDQWVSEVRPQMSTASEVEGAVALGTRRPDHREHPQPAAGHLPDRARSACWTRLPLAASLLCHAPDRGRLGPAVRAAAGRPRARLHDFGGLHQHRL
jgi:integrase